MIVRPPQPRGSICFLLFAILYVVSYFIITRYKRKSDEQEDEDAIVNRISSLVMATLLSSRLFLSTFTLAVSAGAVLLLPFSIISNEILLSFPQNYYIQWLNGSLIHGLWNLASLFSNLCLFVLMPFAFFFLESEGFAGLKKGIRARILETLVMLLLLALLILGIVWVASALIDNDAASMESLYDLWEFYLPYLYSCISLMGCLLLLLCTPVGLSRMFTVMGQLLVKPTILEDLDEQIYIITLEEEALQRRLNVGMLCAGNPEVATGRQVPEEQAGQLLLGKWIQEGGDMTANPRLSSSVEYNIMELEQELENVKTLKTKLDPWSSFSVLQSPVWHFAAQTPANIVSPDSHFMLSTQGMSWAQLVFLLPASRPGNSQDKRRKKASAWERNLVYPAVMVLLLIETSISVLLVACNILCLLVDETAMPKGTRGPGIGNASLSTFGFVGAALEIILIFYLMVSSVVGFYSLRFFGNFTPKKDDTTMTKIIGNCVSILVLSSALPVMSRTLGITRFDLLGDFGRFNWLGNFYIVLSYNLLFAIVTTLCLVRKFTSAVREELFKALGLHKLHLPNTSRDSETAKTSVNGHQKAL
nr:limb region 1 protein homolog isoform X4 [Pan troglodytes]